jgi:uncharacterized membrane protein YvbJ
MNYCIECGYKLEGEFKFCPNCGTELKSSSDSAAGAGKVEDVIICKNCGEENSLQNLNCFSCGVPLKGSKNTKQASEKYRDKKNSLKESDDAKYSKSENIKSEEKSFNNLLICCNRFCHCSFNNGGI